MKAPIGRDHLLQVERQQEFSAVRHQHARAGQQCDAPDPENRLGPAHRADRINNRHDHWQNVHNGWYHGYWSGHWGYGAGYQHPWAAWGVTSAAIGLTSWAAGSLFYDTGYDEYANPYWDRNSVPAPRISSRRSMRS